MDDEELRIDNWMTRYLVRKVKGRLKVEHLKLAKSILEYKCLVGLLDHFEESMERIQFYFGLVEDDTAPTGDGGGIPLRSSKRLTGMKCVKEYNSGKRQNVNQHAVFKPGDREWDLLAEKNQYDIELFQFANELWDRQGKMLKERDHSASSASWNYRRKRRKPH